MPSPGTRHPVPGAVLDVELSDEGGAPVVQLHGLTSSRVRDRLLHLDLGRGLSGTRLLRYDARSHGRSTGRPVPGDHTWSSLADDLLGLLDAFFPGEAVHGVGPSMGCATLLHAAVREPGRFRGLTLVLPPTAWATRAAKAEEYHAAAALVEREGMAAFTAAGRLAPRPPASVETPLTEPDVDAALLPALLRGAAASDLPPPEALAVLADLRLPVRLLAWTEDPAHPVSTAEALARVLPHARLEVAATPSDLQRWPGLLADDVAGSPAGR